MAIFSLDNIRKNKIRYSKYLNEIQVNGEDINDDDDFTMDDEEDEDVGEETPQDTAQNAVENPDESTEQAAEELGATDTTAEDDNAEAPAEGDDTDNFTMDDEDLSTTGDDTTDTADTISNDTTDEEDNFTLEDTDTNNDTTAETSDNAGNAAGTDNTSTETEVGDNTDQTADAGTTDDEASNDDFTMNDSNSDGEGTAEGDDTTGEGTDEGGGNTDGAAAEDAPPADPTDNISDEDIKTSEEQIYDSLTDDQKRIRVLQLKIDYKDLYETIITTKEGINSIPKTMENLDAIKRLILFVEKTKNILIDYIQNNFDKNPYLENYAMYIKFMSVFRTISKVIEDINNSKK